MTLTEFLAARLDEDESIAAAAGHGCGYIHEHNGGWLEVALPDEHNARPSYEMNFIRRFDPDRALAEIKAKRTILKRARESNGYWGKDVERAMLLPYLDHPDCNHEWWQ